MNFRLGGTARLVFHIYVPSVLMGFSLGMLLPTIPALALAFRVAPELAAQAVTALLLGRTAFQFPAGFVVDRFGRRPAMVTGPLLVVAGVLLTVTTPWFGLVLFGQFLVGAGEGLWSLGREIAAVEEIRAEHRGRVLGSFFGISTASTALGPVVGGQLTDHAGYSAAFVAAGVLALAVCGIGLTYRERRTRIARKAERPSLHRLFASVAPGYETTFRLLMFVTFVAMLRSTTLQSLLPVHVVSHLGYTASDVGWLFGLVGLTQLVMLAPAGYLSDVVGRKSAVVPAATLAGLGFVVLGLAETQPALTAGAVVLGIAAGLATGANTTYTYDIISPEARGTSQAFRRSIGEIGSFSGPILGGLVAGATHPGIAFLLFAPLHFASALLVALVAKESLGRRRVATAEAEARTG